MISSNIINITEVEPVFPIKYDFRYTQHNNIFNDTFNIFHYILPITNGIGIGIIEIGLFLAISLAISFVFVISLAISFVFAISLAVSFVFAIGSILRDEFVSLRKINIISYFWLLMTVLTFIWEITHF
jgi:hypothetical protein